MGIILFCVGCDNHHPPTTPSFPPLPEIAVKRLLPILDHTDATLKENVLPYHLDQSSNHNELVLQARLIWSLVAAHRHGFTEQGYLARAQQGINFLIDHFWDQQYGGFFREINKDGTPRNANKSTYGHVHAILALAEYSIAANDTDSLAWAEKVFDLLQTKATDGESGYFDWFSRDWGNPESQKMLNVALHTLEAFTVLTQASGKREHRTALANVLDLFMTKLIHQRYGYVVEEFNKHWIPQTNRSIIYGHNVELAWVALDAIDTLGESREKYRQKIMSLVDYPISYGFDTERGGIATYGQPLQKAVTSSSYKGYWEQAEMLAGLIKIYQWTKAEKYLILFEKQFDWIWKYQIDHQHGSWFERVDWNSGKPLSATKADSPYHHLRALIIVNKTIKDMLFNDGD